MPRGVSPSLSSQSHRLELPSRATDIFGGIQSPWHCPIGRLAPPHLSSISLRSVTRTSLPRSEEHTSELQSLMRNSYAVFCLKKKNNKLHNINNIDCSRIMPNEY